jgi:hypothetical protein
MDESSAFSARWRNNPGSGAGREKKEKKKKKKKTKKKRKKSRTIENSLKRLFY